MNAIKVFVFEEAERPLRCVMREGEPWFVAKDVCTILDHSNPTMAVEPLDEDEKADLSLTEVSSNGVEQGRNFLAISESGLYTMILRSRQAVTQGSVAHRFRRWVTGEVLPALRKTGRYNPDPADNWDWEAIGAKVQLVRETRLSKGKKAASALWDVLGLPTAELPRDVPKTGALQGIDFVRQFLGACTAEAPGGRVQASELKRKYDQWALDEKAPYMTAKAFAMCLDSIGISKAKAHNHYYLGIRILHLNEVAH